MVLRYLESMSSTNSSNRSISSSISSGAAVSSSEGDPRSTASKSKLKLESFKHAQLSDTLSSAQLDSSFSLRITQAFSWNLYLKFYVNFLFIFFSPTCLVSLISVGLVIFSFG